MREVVVTGMGLISCIGNDLDTVSKNLKAGKSGIKLNQEYVDMGFRSHVCGSIDVDLKPLIDRKVLRFMGNALPINLKTFLSINGFKSTSIDPHTWLLKPISTYS